MHAIAWDNLSFSKFTKGSETHYYSGFKSGLDSDGNLVLLTWEEGPKIVRFDTELRAIDTASSEWIRDEFDERLFVGTAAAHIISLHDRKDTLSVFHRRCELGSSSMSEPEVIHKIHDDLEGGTHAAISRDSAFAVVWTFGEDNRHDDPVTGAEYTAINLDAVVIDLEHDTLRSVEGRVRVPENWDTDDCDVQATIDSRGIVTIIIIGEYEGEWHTFLAQSEGTAWKIREGRIPGTLFDRFSIESPQYGLVTGLAVAPLPDGGLSIAASMVMDDEVLIAFRGIVDAADMSIDFSGSFVFDLEYVSTLTDSAVTWFDNDWELVEQVVHEDNLATLLLWKHRVSTVVPMMGEMTSGGGSSTHVVGPVLAYTIDPNGQVVGSAFVRINPNYWDDAPSDYIERRLTHFASGGKLSIAFHDRSRDGLVAYSFPVREREAVPTSQVVAILDDDRHGAIPMSALWFGHNRLLIPIQAFGRGIRYTILRLAW